jgi:hypothetical protein
MSGDSPTSLRDRTPRCDVRSSAPGSSGGLATRSFGLGCRHRRTGGRAQSAESVRSPGVSAWPEMQVDERHRAGGCGHVGASLSRAGIDGGAAASVPKATQDLVVDGERVARRSVEVQIDIEKGGGLTGERRDGVLRPGAVCGPRRHARISGERALRRGSLVPSAAGSPHSPDRRRRCVATIRPAPWRRRCTPASAGSCRRR